MARSEGQTGVFIVWDTEDVTVERRDAGTVHDRTVVTSRAVKPVYALWTNDTSGANVAAAERYIATTIAGQYENLRVEVFTEDCATSAQ